MNLVMFKIKKIFNSTVAFICKSKLFLMMMICCILVEFTIARMMPYVDTNGMSVEKLNNMEEIGGGIIELFWAIAAHIKE